jgi:rhamnosyl/mannosyltransferase
MITCEIGTGTSYVNQHQETGLVVEPNHAKQFGEALDIFWTQPEQVTDWGLGALKRYQEHFTVQRMSDAYVSTYRQLLGR